jgi:hypothetical protein
MRVFQHPGGRCARLENRIRFAGLAGPGLLNRKRIAIDGDANDLQMRRMSCVSFLTIALCAAAAFAPNRLLAGIAPVTAPEAPAPDWLTGENVNIGGVLFPHVHFQSVYGNTTSALGHELGAGHHDPVEDGWTVQGFELGLSGRWSEHFETYVAWHGYWGNEDPNGFDHEFEEYFLKVKNLPGGLELRGGRFLNRFGLHNASHLHGWDWADNFLVNGRFLGDDGQYTRGGEITWQLPVKWAGALSFSAGQANAEAHAHGEEEEEHEAVFEADAAMFDSTLYTVNWTNLWEWNDFHSFRGGLSYAWGDNLWGRRTSVLGAHVQYEWRANGAARGGDYFRWRTEVMLRDVKAFGGHHHEEEEGHEEEEEHSGEMAAGSFDEWGLYSSLVYGRDVKHGILEAGLRGEWVEGVSSAGLPGRTRFSPGLTWYLNDTRNAYLRVQYNRDHIEDHGSEDSVWFGVGLNWGGSEVR